jgi:hypothetical protein
MIVTLTSQGISALALISIVVLGPRLSDAYSIAIQVGTSAFSGVVLQVLYFVAIGRPWFSSWSLWLWLSGGFSVVFASAVAAFGLIAGDGSLEQTVIVLIFGAGGIFLALAGVHAVRLACLGRPLLMIGVTILPNAALAVATTVVGLVDFGGATATFLPAACWALGSAGIWVIGLLRPRPGHGDDLAAAEDGPREQVVQSATLGIGLVANTIYPSFFIAALANLPTGSTTLLFLVSRIGTSFVGLFVNSVLAVRFNWRTESASLAPIATRFTVVAALVGTAGFVLQLAGIGTPATVVVAIAWLAALIATPLVVRELYAKRFVRASAVKVAVDVLVTLSVGTWFIVHPSISGFFGVYMAQQAGSLICCGFALRRPALIVAASLLLTVGIGLVVG